jgi:hypothetical protein
LLKPITLSESEVLEQVVKYLLFDSRVIIAKRINSGILKSKMFSRSVRHIKQGNDLHDIDSMKTCDIEGMLIDGRKLIIEVKAGDFKLPKSENYLADALDMKSKRKQKERETGKKQPESEKERVFWQKVAIDTCNQYGGVAGFATSIADVSRLLDSAF